MHVYKNNHLRIMTYVELSVKLQYNMQFYFWSHPCFSSGVGEEISRGGREGGPLFWFTFEARLEMCASEYWLAVMSASEP